MLRLVCVCLLLAAVLAAAAPTSAAPITGPEQPADGPGGAAYVYDEVAAQHYGEAPTGYWLFEPVVEEGAASALPVVLFLHGYMAIDPDYYRGWIDHLVRRGHVVVFPDYQTSDPLSPAPIEYTSNMAVGVGAALEELTAGDHVPVQITPEPEGDWDGAVSVVGHSMGGVLALNYAAVARRVGLPIPTAVMPVVPGGCKGCGGPGGSDAFGVPYANLSAIDRDTKLMIVVGEDDDFVGQRPAQIAWGQTGHIPDDNRDYLVVRTDRHGEPPLVADHGFMGAPITPDGIDALDYHGGWKWFDGLIACAGEPSACTDVMNGGDTQLDMGEWSDGTPVTEPILVESP